MSIVTIRNVEFLNNPARFLDPYHFRVTFECIAPLPEDLEWRLIYVASPGNEELDQELDDCLVGPVPVGVNAFEFEGSAPNPSKIPPEDVLGVAALILTGSYKDQEFVRVGYYQNTEYDNEEMKEALPDPIRFDSLVRDINQKPRVTRFQIKWDSMAVPPTLEPYILVIGFFYTVGASRIRSAQSAYGIGRLLVSQGFPRASLRF